MSHPSEHSDFDRDDREYTRFETPDWVDDPSALCGGDAPQQFGKYRVKEYLGEGGLGAVYLATQTERDQSDEEDRQPGGDAGIRDVAIKIVKRNVDHPVLRERMKLEWHLLAKFNHPNIAGFIDCGYLGNGERVPFLVMEYIANGEDIVRYCQGNDTVVRQESAVNGQKRRRRERLELRACLELFLQACEGLSHAHQRSVIHRDISAKNVMVTELDVAANVKKPIVKIIDFGIAGLNDAPAAAAIGGGRSAQTVVAVGTLAYMSPEQLEAPENLNALSDVYSMGVLLFELVTGTRPYPASTKEEVSAAQTTIRTRGQAVVPSTKVLEQTRMLNMKHEVQTRGQLKQRRQLLKDLRGDLDAIILKATALEPDRRYGSIQDLAEDLRDYLTGYPPRIVGRAGPWTRFRKFVGRNLVACTAAAAAMIFLVTTAVSNYYAAKTQTKLNVQLQASELEARNRGNALDTQFHKLRSTQADAYAAQFRALPDLLSEGKIDSLRKTLIGTALSGSTSSISREWEWDYLLGKIDAHELTLGLSGAGFVNVFTVGGLICGVAADGSLWFWKADTGEFKTSYRPHQARRVLAACAAGKSCYSFDAAGELVRWNSDNGAAEPSTPTGIADLQDATAAFHPDGTLFCLHRPGKKSLDIHSVAARPGEKPAQSLSIPDDSSEVRLSWNEESLVCIGFSPDVDHEHGGTVWMRQWRIDAESGSAEEVRRDIVDLSFLGLPLGVSHARGRFLLAYDLGALSFRFEEPVTTNADDATGIDIKNAKPLVGHGEGMATATLSADGKLAATGGTDKDRTIRIWNAVSGEFQGRLTGERGDVGNLLGHDGAVTKLAFTPDGLHLFSASADGTVRKWKTDAPHSARYLKPRVPDSVMEKYVANQTTMSWLRFLPGPRLELLGVFSHYPYFVVWDVENGEIKSQPVKDENARPAFLPEPYELALAAADRSGEVIALLRHHPENETSDLFVGDRMYFEHATITSVQSFSQPVRHLIVSNDGHRLAVALGGNPASIQLWNLTDGVMIGEPTIFDTAAESLAFNSGGTKLAAGGDGFLNVWDLSRPGTPPQYLQTEKGTLQSLAFNSESIKRGDEAIADGRWIVAAASKPTNDPDDSEATGLFRFDLETGEVIEGDLGRGTAQNTFAAAWSPNGVRVATAENDRSVRIWAMDEGFRHLFTLADARGFLDSVAWSNDGQWIAAGSPFEGVFLYQGVSSLQREADFLLRELQRDTPISVELKSRWKRISLGGGDSDRLKPFLRRNDDDPGTVESWAWMQLASRDDDAAHATPQTKVSSIWLEVRKLLETACLRRNDDVNLLLLRGVAEYRCGGWDAAATTLTKYARARDLLAVRPVDAGERTTKDFIGILHLALACSKSGRYDAARSYWNVASWLARRPTLDMNVAQEQAVLHSVKLEAEKEFAAEASHK